MALNLDTRQRAMLQDMGITIWWPKPAAAAPVPAAPPAVAVVAVADPVAAPAVAVHPATPPAPTAAPTPVAPAVAAAAPAPQPRAQAVPAPAAEAVPATAWRMAPAVQAYPQAAGGSADDGWLVIWEGPHPGAPLTGDSGKLLDNMLRALRLHHSAHVWIAGVQRPGSEALSAAGLAAEAVDWQPLDQSLPHCLQHTRPARVLVLGLHAARAVLGSEEALGRLRAQVHQLHGTPAVVSYDPAYLLRSPHAKPAAWADLCRAHALRPPPAP